MRAYVWKFPLTVGAVLALATSAGAATIDLPTDEYLCYGVGASKVPAQAKFAGAQISSKDQFENLAFRNFAASKILKHCNPTLPSPPSGNAAVHLVEYGIKDSKVNANSAKFAAPGTAFNLTDRFGMISVTISKPKSVLVRSGKGCDNPSATPCPVGPVTFPSNLASTADYTCYSVKGPKISIPAGAFDDQFAQPGATYTLAKLTGVCAPTNKGNGGSLGPDTTASQRGVHLVCYGFKRTGPKFLVRHVQDGDPMIFPGNGVFLDAKKPAQICIPALKAAAPGMPALTTPTKLTTQAVAAGGNCGSLTTNGGPGEGVPGRLDPANASVDPNAACTGAGAPKACCTGSAAGHCDERTSITCGSLTFGGGGTNVASPGAEGGSAGGGRSRYALSCGSATGTCTISGDPGDIPNGINCSQTGCAGVAPVDTTSPIKVCAISKLGANASGTLDLATGTISLATNTSTTVNLGTTTSFANHGCPRCRTGGTATTNPEAFAVGNTPGTGQCDTDAANAGAACTVFEPAGAGQGLSADCNPVASGSALLAITTTSSTGGMSVSDPAGHFCAGQGGNADCTGSGAPNPCCTGSGAGSCLGYNGCFGSGKFADTPATCTGINVTGSQAGFLLAGDPGAAAAYGAVSCIPAVNAGPFFSPVINGGIGLPGPVVTSTKDTLSVQ